MIIECVGIHHKALNPCKIKSTNFLPLKQVFILFVYMHQKQIPMQEWICMKCPQTSHVEGDQFLH